MAWKNAPFLPRAEGGIGPGNARNAATAFRRLIKWAENNGHLPRLDITKYLEIAQLVSRTRVWSPSEMRAMVSAAMDAKKPSVALEIQLGWWLGQRPADLRVVAWSAYDGHAIQLRRMKSRRLNAEGKVVRHGKLVRIPIPPELKAALEAAPRASTQIVVSEETGRPYQGSAFQHLFARLRQSAGLPNDLQFRDLRRTVATTLGSAGATVHEILSVTGQQTLEILET